jgi:pimeloyl-ACP methyl ester carboxylesterase
MRLLLFGLLILAAVYLLLLAAAWAWQERIVWQPPRGAAALDPTTHRISYSADDGQPLYAYLVGDPSPARAAGLLIAFHGNAELAADGIPWAAEVARRTGWAVLVPEYRGYGGLTGSPDYPGSQRDARATYALARERLVTDSSRLAYYGHSLGTAVATELASEHPPAALLLVSPFTSARDMARTMYGPPVWALWRAIGRVKFDTRAKVAALDVPVSVAHGDGDGVIPAWMGRAVHAAARVKGELLIAPRAGHNDVPSVPEYWAWLERALAAASRPARSAS